MFCRMFYHSNYEIGTFIGGLSSPGITFKCFSVLFGVNSQMTTEPQLGSEWASADRAWKLSGLFAAATFPGLHDAVVYVVCTLFISA